MIADGVKKTSTYQALQTPKRVSREATRRDEI
jgi:hypothetical protein